jgi:hypothetical protein
MSTYDQKKVRSLINAASAHRQHPGGELAVQLAEQLSAVDEIIAASQRATVDAQTVTRRAQQDLQIANEESRQMRERVAPYNAFLEALKEIATTGKGKIKAVALTALKAGGIELEPAKPSTPQTPPA